MREIRKYEVFKKSHKLALDVYRVTATFPQIEVYGLAAQTRRAAYSIPMNLAEGVAREGAKEFAQFVNIAIGSCEELRYQLFLAKDLSYIGEKNYRLLEQGYESIKRMLTQLYKKLRTANS
ncbi:MAG: four helix bundle protein [candidate division WOR-3 bacterium]|nr:four helix bundle protein [candidate division WOR-3 bacterium]